MRISFHKDAVDEESICDDLRLHGVVYWHTTRPNFRRVADYVQAQGLQVLSTCARCDGEFLSFLARADSVDALQPLTDAVSAAIERWQDLGEPVPHVERL